MKTSRDRPIKLKDGKYILIYGNTTYRIPVDMDPADPIIDCLAQADRPRIRHLLTTYHTKEN